MCKNTGSSHFNIHCCTANADVKGIDPSILHCSNLVAKNTYFVGCFRVLSCEVFSWHEFSCMRFVLDVSLVLRVSPRLAVKCQVYSRLNIGA